MCPGYLPVVCRKCLFALPLLVHGEGDPICLHQMTHLSVQAIYAYEKNETPENPGSKDGRQMQKRQTTASYPGHYILKLPLLFVVPSNGYRTATYLVAPTAADDGAGGHGRAVGHHVIWTGGPVFAPACESGCESGRGKRAQKYQLEPPDT